MASSFVSRAYDGRGRATALGVLNFSGDLGKFIVPLVLAFSLTAYGWRASLFALGAVSLLFAWGFWRSLYDKDRQRPTVQTHKPSTYAQTIGWGIQHPKTFSVIVSMGILDASVRSALLTFMPFLLLDKGMTEVQAAICSTQNIERLV